MGDYQLDDEYKGILIRYAKRYPEGYNMRSFPYHGTPIDFHLDMYALAEEFDASFLKRTVHQKLSEALLTEASFFSVSDLAILINMVFHISNGKVIEDEERHIANIVTASVILHEQKNWDHSSMEIFWKYVPDSGIFAEDYKKAKAENVDLWTRPRNPNPGRE
jgi:hypothetical protein